MLEDISYAFNQTKKHISKAAGDCNRTAEQITLIAVSKQQQEDRIEASLSYGQRVFGENRVQEAHQRWKERKKNYSDLSLHLIGPLQSNKVADAVRLFDVIHTVDRPKIATAISKEAKKQNKHIQCFIQVNTGEEPQKSGVLPGDLDNFIDFCKAESNLEIMGLMCIPPLAEEAAIHFAFLNGLASRNNLTGLSMGMSGDYEEAIKFGATHIRVGSALFGSRN
jgi:pyridoxal phosphate enzyme (YggS family)